jgi:(p)ppGpp synthase/HD superfamily hydrolase
MTVGAPICEHRRVISPVALASFVSGMPVSRRAAVWAAEAHHGQDRDVDGGPFVMHPLEVALMLHCAGYRDAVVAAAILHDVVEKTDIGLDVVDETFGPEIAAMVDVLSEDPRITDYDARKQALRERAGASAEEVVAVFAADKIIGARELRLAAAVDRLSARDAATKRAHLVECLAVVERRLPDHPFTDALRFELAAHLAVPALAWLQDAPAAAPAAVS